MCLVPEKSMIYFDIGKGQKTKKDESLIIKVPAALFLVK